MPDDSRASPAPTRDAGEKEANTPNWTLSFGDGIKGDTAQAYLRRRGWSELAIAALARKMRMPDHLRLDRKKPAPKK